MTVNQAMIEAGAIASYFRRVDDVDQVMIDRFRASDAFNVWCEQTRAALETTLSVMPAPTDADVDAAIANLIDAASTSGPMRQLKDASGQTATESTRAHLLRLIAQREAAAKHEGFCKALEAVREFVSKPRKACRMGVERDQVQLELLNDIIRHIDAMLAQEVGE